jgi:hypothetical protein
MTADASNVNPFKFTFKSFTLHPIRCIQKFQGVKMSPPQASSAILSVEVKAIRIDGRRMTITVFQQLPVMSLVVDPQGDSPSIREGYKPWGYVRDEGDVWLVAERNGALYRASLYITDVRDFSHKADSELSKFRKAVFEKCEQLFIAV